MVDKTSAVLDSMVADVVNRKPRSRTAQDETKGAQGTQTPPDGSNGQAGPELGGSVAQMQAAIAEHTVRIGVLVQAIQKELSDLAYASDLLLSPLPPAGPKELPLEEARKKAEAEADQRAKAREIEKQAEFETIQAAKAEAAKAATFTDKPEASSQAPESDAWTCPDHGKSAWKTSPKGRQYLACPVEGCGEFERQR